MNDDPVPRDIASPSADALLRLAPGLARDGVALAVWRLAGIGRVHPLLRAALAWARERGRRKASLTVREDRAPALRLYEGVGLRQIRAGVHWRRRD